MEKAQVFNYTCSRLAHGRYIATHRMNRKGWILVTNCDTAVTLRVLTNENDKNFVPIMAGQSKPIQYDDGTVITISSPVIGVKVRLEEAIYKCEAPTYWHDEDRIGNTPFCATGVITTTYNCTTLDKGYATYVQVIADNGTGFIGTIEISSTTAGATVWSSPIPLLESDPNKRAWEENRIVTYIRVTRTAGTFTVYYR